jgi:maltooligosyltrehalose trehalohydrolase
VGDGATLHLLANLSDQVIAHHAVMAGTKIWGADLGASLPPWSVFWHIGAR